LGFETIVDEKLASKSVDEKLKTSFTKTSEDFIFSGLFNIG